MILLITPSVIHAQSKSTTDFITFVGKEFQLPQDLKYNCEWMYAVVRVKTDVHNRIISYDFVNKIPEDMKHSFDFLHGYRFPQTMKINKHPIVFYLSVNNTEICKPKADDFKYTPNQVVNIIATILLKIQKDDPKTIFIPEMITKEYYQSQR